MKKNKFTLIKLFLWLVICQLPGVLSAPFVYPNLDWYRQLIKPPFIPPEGIFGPVWALLYVSLGLSAFFAFREKFHARPLALFAGQLVLNVCWTPVFFGAHSLLGALLLLLAMLGEMTGLFKAFWRTDRRAAYLLLPYSAWLVFATYLTIGVWWLN
ncbi:MAG: tryptophan-rich sensory protein [Elusimicrobiaceae bacterium]|nr:tryptophan-rich sensory protein [Elusimicrobiaceae bacterium]